MAFFFSASGRRLLSTAAAASVNTKLPVSIPHLRSLARAGCLEDIDTALAPFIPSSPVGAIFAFSVIGLPDRGSAILSTIRSPTSAHINALLSPLVRQGRLVGLVPGLLDAHPSAPRDAVTNSILARSLCATSGPDSALHLLQGEELPSLQVYTSLIDAYYKQKNPHRAEELWRAMVEDHGIAPNAEVYNVRIGYKSTTGTVEEVEELIRAMCETGLRPDIVSYNWLLKVLARHKQVDEALEVYRILRAKGSTAAKSAPNSCTYKCVIGVLCRAQRWSEAEDVFYDAVKRKTMPDLPTMRKLVLGLKEACKGRAARQVVVRLRKEFLGQFDGPWLVLEEAAGLTPEARKEEDEGEKDVQQPVAAA